MASQNRECTCRNITGLPPRRGKDIPTRRWQISRSILTEIQIVKELQKASLKGRERLPEFLAVKTALPPTTFPGGKWTLTAQYSANPESYLNDFASQYRFWLFLLVLGIFVDYRKW